MALWIPILAVVIGFVVANFFKTSEGLLQLLISFSGALLLGLTILKFLPHVFEHPNEWTPAWILLGILIQLFLEFFSKGIEHGHYHSEGQGSGFPFLLFISLCLHALFEGYPIEDDSALLIGVVIHKIPVALILASFMMNSGFSRWKQFIFLGIFALMTPLGALLRLEIGFIAQAAQIIEPLVVGIFLHISTTILFESSSNHSFDLRKMSAILLGLVLAFLLY